MDHFFELLIFCYMKKIYFTLCLLWCSITYAEAQELRAPAYPLITHNPYSSIWSFGDELNQSNTKHWTGADHSLIGMIKVDGEIYRFLGRETVAFRPILGASDDEGYNLSYTESEPAAGWMDPEFDDRGWSSGAAPFGHDKGAVNTNWSSDDLWARRTFTLEEIDFDKFYLKLNHDDNIEVYLNGEEIFQTSGWTERIEYFPMEESLTEKLKVGENILAIHIANTAGGSWLDVGLVAEESPMEEINVIPAEQLSVELNATQTIYQFACGNVDVTATFTSPLLMDNLDVFARPISYVSYKVQANDQASHEVDLYFGASSNIAVNSPDQEVQAQKYASNSLDFLKAGTVKQPILEKKGDNVRIDWGYMYVAVPESAQATQYISSADRAIMPFASSTEAPSQENEEGKGLVLNTIVPLGAVGNTAKEQVFLLGYDELYAVQYFNQNLKPWWKLDDSNTMEKEMAEAAADYPDVIRQCEDFDEEMYEEAVAAGGEKYADLCELAYRQAIAAHTLVESPEGELLFLSKENMSNGSINTVDVTYPSAPLFLVYNPDLLKGMLNGIFYYSESGRWDKPFAAHDLGTYPIANGQTYGGDMPVEESGNMLILTGVIAKVEGNADYAQKHWETLTTWAEYLEEHGFDPENQLSTDDFAGHLARNANLSVKAIMGLALYGELAGMLGKEDVEKKYVDVARDMARRWMELADDGDHYTLAFEEQGTWSQKYNLVWDKILDLDIFPKSVREKEIDFYLSKQQEYGLPLDNRETYTKSDWVLWTATLADSEEDFKALVAPVWKYANETSDRVPVSDWHRTTDAKVMNFRARSVVGGYFIKLLEMKLDETVTQGM